ncbi:MAG: hypothetical protein NC548_60970, partial [Lachnospiraceae bacterium]|nr:hypothetical protein [Lachnospiraceae bacterium]MCM1231108.1 hypothetical protein [Ruminococcus flavefaciens]
MTDFFFGVVFTVIVTWLFYKLFFNRDGLVNPDMEEVKEHIEKAEELRAKLDCIDRMITDFELTVDPDMCVSKNLRMIYGERDGQYKEVEILMTGDYTTRMLLEMLSSERARIANDLLDETEKIPKRHRPTVK